MELSSSARYLVRSAKTTGEHLGRDPRRLHGKAQHRLHKRHLKLGAAGNEQRMIVTAVARELLGFIWAIGTRAETVSRRSKLQPDNNPKQNLLRRKRIRTLLMNADIHLEHRASSSQGKHEGEPSLGLCDRLNRTRDNSQRQLPTDHDYAVPTREYQTDQSSLKTAPTAARSVFGKGQKQRPRQEQFTVVRS